MSRKFTDWQAVDPKSVLSAAQRRYFEDHLPILRGLSAAERAELAAQARPGESWEQLVGRVTAERRLAFLADAEPCRLCQSVEQYQTERCKHMGLCDACNVALEAEAGAHLGADDD